MKQEIVVCLTPVFIFTRVACFVTTKAVSVGSCQSNIIFKKNKLIIMDRLHSWACWAAELGPPKSPVDVSVGLFSLGGKIAQSKLKCHYCAFYT